MLTPTTRPWPSATVAPFEATARTLEEAHERCEIESNVRNKFESRIVVVGVRTAAQESGHAYKYPKEGCVRGPVFPMYKTDAQKLGDEYHHRYGVISGVG